MAEAARELEARRRDLGMSRRVLAERAGLGQATVNRALLGEEVTAGTLERIASAMGAQVRVRPGASVTDMRLAQARRKAERLVRLVRGSAGLEAQAFDDGDARAMVERTVKELLAGSDRNLWAD